MSICDTTLISTREYAQLKSAVKCLECGRQNALQYLDMMDQIDENHDCREVFKILRMFLGEKCESRAI